MTAGSIGKDKVVSLTYTLLDERREVFEQVEIPVSYLHGHGNGLFEKVERILEGRRAGDSIEVTLTPDEGFGPHNPSLSFTDDLENVPPDLRYVGARLEAQNARGENMNFIVTKIENGKLTVDANHPLAGQTVHFNLSVRDVRDATRDEIRNGQAEAAVTLQ